MDDIENFFMEFLDEDNQEIDVFTNIIDEEKEEEDPEE